MKAISFDLFDMTPLGPSGNAFLAAPPALRLAPPEHGWIDLFIVEHEAFAPIMLGDVSPSLDDLWFWSCAVAGGLLPVTVRLHDERDDPKNRSWQPCGSESCPRISALIADRVRSYPIQTRINRRVSALIRAKQMAMADSGSEDAANRAYYDDFSLIGERLCGDRLRLTVVCSDAYPLDEPAPSQ